MLARLALTVMTPRLFRASWLFMRRLKPRCRLIFIFSSKSIRFIRLELMKFRFTLLISNNRRRLLIVRRVSLIYCDYFRRVNCCREGEIPWDIRYPGVPDTGVMSQTVGRATIESAYVSIQSAGEGYGTIAINGDGVCYNCLGNTFNGSTVFIGSVVVDGRGIGPKSLLKLRTLTILRRPGDGRVTPESTTPTPSSGPPVG